MNRSVPKEFADQTESRDGCMVWTGPVSAGDHPRVYIGGKRWLLRRALLDLWGYRGSGFQVNMDCGNNSCISPDHMNIRKVKRRMRDARPDKSGEYGRYWRDSNLWKLYGITLLQWEGMFDAQGKQCAICGSTDPRGRNWHTDHCHKTGVVRGILCGCCNSAIGKMNEDPRVMAKAAEYLSKFKGVD